VDFAGFGGFCEFGCDLLVLIGFRDCVVFEVGII